MDERGPHFPREGLVFKIPPRIARGPDDPGIPYAVAGGDDGEPKPGALLHPQEAGVVIDGIRFPSPSHSSSRSRPRARRVGSIGWRT